IHGAKTRKSTQHAERTSVDPARFCNSSNTFGAYLSDLCGFLLRVVVAFQYVEQPKVLRWRQLENEWQQRNECQSDSYVVISKNKSRYGSCRRTPVGFFTECSREARSSFPRGRPKLL
ncbi:hypothetical protein PHET_12380, partial [Paragonimus heterotremus]